MLIFPPLHPDVTSSAKILLVTPGSHLFSTFLTDFKTIIGIPWNPPNSIELELELWHQFQDWNLNWGSIPIPKFGNGIGIGIDGIVPMTGNY